MLNGRLIMNEYPIHYTVNDLWPAFESIRDRFDVNSGHKTFPDIKEPPFWSVYQRCKPYTLLPTERFYNLYTAVRYIAENKILGDFVECGVLLGGASVGIAMFCNHFGIGDRKHFLFDTFCGFPHPVVETDFAGRKVPIGASPNFRAIVERQIASSGLDPSRFVLVEGDVAQTLPHESVKRLCLLRLDTDDHDSILHELRALYPTLTAGGVLIIDDYGHFEGARRAVDSYFSTLSRRPYLQRIDYGGRCAVK
jgi:O-methyltransferase